MKRSTLETKAGSDLANMWEWHGNITGLNHCYRTLSSPESFSQIRDPRPHPRPTGPQSALYAALELIGTYCCLKSCRTFLRAENKFGG